jgi:hypothetical protein
MKKAIVFLALSFTSLTSCTSAYVATTQRESSGLVGCHPKEINIESTSFGGHTWAATCKNTKFYCGKNKDVVSCTEAK